MELQIFKNEQFGEVQLVEINNEPWFIGKEIAEILGYKNSRDALSKHVDEEDKGVAKRDTLGGSQDQVIINESGLYSLILKSKLPQAKQFKRWVTSEVLPAIRKHGGYLTDNKLEEALLNPDTLISLATQLKEEREARKQLQVANSQLMVDNQIMQPKAQYFDDLVARNLLTSFRDTAKMLKIKEREFINWLLDKKFLYRDKKGKLVPFANKNDGLFEIKETKNESTAWKGTQTLVTPKGRETFNILLRV
ncbi:TPA: phage antirepressor KilAC domain-containing protein [Streptococcus suis]|uniref:BRO family protein n=2 Tax=Streptococcus suis TaxID=1307 RepID=UPI000945DF44|nr:BRO family protein [Streptococcus suis]HEL1562054.1 phage antirepressor KilAC domain-containing protein [Streptococcus suis]HEL1921767.1 phage antirepressor KilAC domain-containing protein [Streptococcus suis]HEL1957424.1 phage antirepressor KilAC domain-containing protein [Streptococcus suis]HEL2125474.1 phage antirepressor KilAC domain-containing protein [Streptococcus suis]HEL2127781.1 phage antirepressor KilAC domain-containing protein [Streptococcus suis]